MNREGRRFAKYLAAEPDFWTPGQLAAFAMTTRLPHLARAMANVSEFLSPTAASTVLYLYRSGLDCGMHSGPWTRYRRAWRPTIREAIKLRHKKEAPCKSE